MRNSLKYVYTDLNKPMYSVHCEIISALKCLVVAPVETDRSDQPSQENAYVLAEDRTHLILSYIQFFLNG